ncbi:MAG: glycosyltransferase, partial [Litorimonas sp.]
MAVLLDAIRSSVTTLLPWTSKAFWTSTHPANADLPPDDQIVHPLLVSPDTARWHREMERRRAEMALPEPTEPDDWPLISVCMVMFESAPLIESFIAALQALDYPADRLELVLVDNQSSDGSWERSERFPSDLEGWRRVERLRRPNEGYGTSQNAAVAAARGDFILLLNPDGAPAPDSLRRAVVRALSDRADVAAWEFRQSPAAHPKYHDPVTWETGWN